MNLPLISYWLIMARQQTRTYTCELQRIKAIWFKPLFGMSSNKSMRLNSTELSDEHTDFKLQCINDNQVRLTFVIKDRQRSFKIRKNTDGIAPRLFFECPFCLRNRSSLYAATNAYACRECLNLKYLCQSESELDRLGRKIRKKRFQTWGELAFKFDGNNLIENSYYWPKPKDRWQSSFEREKALIESVEARFYSGMSKYLDSISHAKNRSPDHTLLNVRHSKS